MTVIEMLPGRWVGGGRLTSRGQTTADNELNYPACSDGSEDCLSIANGCRFWGETDNGVDDDDDDDDDDDVDDDPLLDHLLRLHILRCFFLALRRDASPSSPSSPADDEDN